MITGDFISVSQPTVSRIVKRVSYLISLKIHLFIKFPKNLGRIKEEFYTIAHFPGIIGAVDGTHIPIQNPGGQYAEVFRNRKKFFSINTQIVCGPDLQIYNTILWLTGLGLCLTTVYSKLQVFPPMAKKLVRTT